MVSPNWSPSNHHSLVLDVIWWVSMIACWAATAMLYWQNWLEHKLLKSLRESVEQHQEATEAHKLGMERLNKIAQEYLESLSKQVESEGQPDQS